MRVRVRAFPSVNVTYVSLIAREQQRGVEAQQATEREHVAVVLPPLCLRQSGAKTLDVAVVAQVAALAPPRMPRGESVTQENDGQSHVVKTIELTEVADHMTTPTGQRDQAHQEGTHEAPTQSGRRS